LRRLLFYSHSFAPILSLEPVAKRAETPCKASCFQFASELRSGVASLLLVPFKKLPMGFNGRMTKATLAFRELSGSDPASNSLQAQTAVARDLSLRQSFSHLFHRDIVALPAPLAILLLTLPYAWNRRRSSFVPFWCLLQRRRYANVRSCRLVN